MSTADELLEALEQQRAPETSRYYAIITKNNKLVSVWDTYIEARVDMWLNKRTDCSITHAEKMR